MRFVWKSEFTPECVITAPYVSEEQGNTVIQFQQEQGITHFILVYADISGADHGEIIRRLEGILDANGLTADVEDPGLHCRVRVISHAEYVLNRGLLIGNASARYTVIGCGLRGDCLTVSLPDALAGNVVTISQTVDVVISRYFVEKRGGFLGLRAKKEPTAYWTVRISGVTQGYEDGDILYRMSVKSRGQPIFADVPVNQEMLSVQFYIKSGSTVPDFICPNNKYNLNIRCNKGDANGI